MNLKERQGKWRIAQLPVGTCIIWFYPSSLCSHHTASVSITTFDPIPMKEAHMMDDLKRQTIRLMDAESACAALEEQDQWEAGEQHRVSLTESDPPEAK